MENLTGIAARMADFQPVLSEPVSHKYYIGDLCYVLTSDDWDTYCAAFDWKDPNTFSEEEGYDPEVWLDPEAGEWEVWLADKGEEPWRPCFTFNTAYGDCCYADEHGNQYCVDSGGIGCIRVDHANAEKLADAVARGLGHIHEFDDVPSVGYEDGLIWFCGSYHQVHIQTGGGYEEVEEEETEEYDG